MPWPWHYDMLQKTHVVDSRIAHASDAQWKLHLIWLWRAAAAGAIDDIGQQPRAGNTASKLASSSRGRKNELSNSNC